MSTDMGSRMMLVGAFDLGIHGNQAQSAIFVSGSDQTIDALMGRQADRRRPLILRVGLLLGVRLVGPLLS